MPDFYHLDLDTIAPEITWGSVSGVGRDRILIARYTVDEPGVVAAQFIDAANVATGLTVLADRLLGRLPSNAAYGQGVIRAWLQDDAGNTSVRSEYVTLLPPTVHLELDTTPPVITWGPVAGTDAGEELVVLYAINEPSLLMAQLQLADSRLLPMQIYPDRLKVTLPDDTPEGLATIQASVRDDVGNAAVRTLVVVLTGLLRPVQRSFPRGPVTVFRRRVTSPVSRVKTRSRDTIEGTLASQERLVTRSAYHSDGQILGLVSRGAVRSRDRRLVTVRDVPSTARASGQFGISRRPEGPQAEAELLVLLGLL